MKNQFDENFYIVSATVIPVLFLALTLQGAFVDRINKYVNEFSPDKAGDQPELLLLLIAVSLAATAGLAGEFLALAALFYQTDNYYIRSLVWIANLALITETGLVPLIAVYRAYFTVADPGGQKLWRLLTDRKDRGSKQDGA